MTGRLDYYERLNEFYSAREYQQKDGRELVACRYLQ